MGFIKISEPNLYQLEGKGRPRCVHVFRDARDRGQV